MTTRFIGLIGIITGDWVAWQRNSRSFGQVVYYYGVRATSFIQGTEYTLNFL